MDPYSVTSNFQRDDTLRARVIPKRTNDATPPTDVARAVAARVSVAENAVFIITCKFASRGHIAAQSVTSIQVATLSSFYVLPSAS